jgi:hypothetical protein
VAAHAIDWHILVAAAGFRLAGVAALVDAEAGHEVLQQEVAVAQVSPRHVAWRTGSICYKTEHDIAC